MQLQRLVIYFVLACVMAASTGAQGAPPQIDAAIAELSARVGQSLSLNTLQNWNWSQETFGDSSLGCPQEGMAYAQVVTAGYIFELTHADTIYEYHTNADGSQVVLCDQRSIAEPTPAPPLEEQYSNPLCPAPTEETGAYPRSRVRPDLQAEGTLAFNRIRATPDTEAAIVGEVPQNGVFTILSGPSCDDEGIVWWEVDFDGIIGWTAEAQGEERYIVPQNPPPTPGLRLLSPEEAPNLRNIGQLQGNFRPELAFSPDGSVLATIGDRGSDALVIFNGNNFTEAPRYLDGNFAMTAVTVHPNGQQALIGSDSGGVHLWNIAPDAPLLESVFLQTHLADVAAVAAYPDGSQFISAGDTALTTATEQREYALILWELANVSQVAVFDEATAPPVELAFSPDGAQVAAITVTGELLIWQAVAPYDVLRTSDAEPIAISMAYSPNNQFFAVGRGDGSITLYDLAGNLVTTLNGHLGAVTALDFSEDNRLLASVSTDGSLRLWNTQTDENVITLSVDDEAFAVLDVEFAPFGTIIATSTEDGIINLFGVPGQ